MNTRVNLSSVRTGSEKNIQSMKLFLKHNNEINTEGKNMKVLGIHSSRSSMGTWLIC